MSYKMTNIFTRPNKDVVFHISTVPDTFVSHVIENYKNTGKVLDIATEVTNNGLSLVVTWVFANQAEYNAYLADPAVVQHRATRDSYNTANGIVLSQTTEEV